LGEDIRVGAQPKKVKPTNPDFSEAHEKNGGGRNRNQEVLGFVENLKKEGLSLVLTQPAHQGSGPPDKRKKKG